MLEHLPPEVVDGATTLGGGGLLFLLGWLTKTASRVVTSVADKWDKDRAQQLAIANHFARATERGLRVFAASLERADERVTVPLEVDQNLIGVEHSGPIRIPQ